MSAAAWLVVVALSSLFASLGYRLAERDRRSSGRTPWGWPPELWAGLWALWLPGPVLYAWALRSAWRPREVVGRHPVYRLPMGVGDIWAGDARATSLSQTPPPSSGLPPAGWYADPSGRFHYRWWDGSRWTSHVATDGHHLIDTNPDQRLGPAS